MQREHENGRGAPLGAPRLSVFRLAAPQPVTRSTTVLLRSLIASTPATTAEPASFATSCATRVTRAIGEGIRELAALLTALLPDDRLPVAALRVALLAAAFLLVDRPRFADVAERAEDALRDLRAPAAAAVL